MTFRAKQSCSREAHAKWPFCAAISFCIVASRVVGAPAGMGPLRRQMTAVLWCVWRVQGDVGQLKVLVTGKGSWPRLFKTGMSRRLIWLSYAALKSCVRFLELWLMFEFFFFPHKNPFLDWVILFSLFPSSVLEILVRTSLMLWDSASLFLKLCLTHYDYFNTEIVPFHNSSWKTWKMIWWNDRNGKCPPQTKEFLFPYFAVSNFLFFFVCLGRHLFWWLIFFILQPLF